MGKQGAKSSAPRGDGSPGGGPAGFFGLVFEFREGAFLASGRVPAVLETAGTFELTGMDRALLAGEADWIAESGI